MNLQFRRFYWIIQSSFLFQHLPTNFWPAPPQVVPSVKLEPLPKCSRSMFPVSRRSIPPKSVKIHLRKVFRRERKTPPNLVNIKGVLSLFFRCFLESNASSWEAGVLPLNYIRKCVNLLLVNNLRNQQKINVPGQCSRFAAIFHSLNCHQLDPENRCVIYE